MVVDPVGMDPDYVGSWVQSWMFSLESPKKSTDKTLTLKNFSVNHAEFRAGIFKLLRSPGIDSYSLCRLAGRYDNPCSYSAPSPH
jgi:hypothetical protein